MRQCIGGSAVNWEAFSALGVFNALWGVQCRALEGYHQSLELYHECSGGYHELCGGYHDLCWGIREKNQK